MQKQDQNGFTDSQKQHFMRMAIQWAQKAYQFDEVPVGCVFVRRTVDNKWAVISGNHNLTNKHKNATRHCEINCMYQMQSLSPQQRQNLILFVTVEPCIMCTYALNIFKIKFVYFGQFNDKFGGCGSVMKRNQFHCEGGILERESYLLIRNFYQRGNMKISQEMRNKRRKKVKITEQQHNSPILDEQLNQNKQLNKEKQLNQDKQLNYEKQPNQDKQLNKDKQIKQDKQINQDKQQNQQIQEKQDKPIKQEKE